MRKFIAYGPALVVLVTALVTLVAAPAAVRMIGYAGTETTILAAQQALDQDTILKQIDKAVRNIADAVEPSVVHIGVLERQGNFMERAGQGSGWVFDDQGHIVTNSHVVRGSDQIVVQFFDGRAVEATVVGQDRSTDIAVLKVKSTEGLFPARRASGLELHQGDRVYAFGSPFGFKFSMSEGIVSGLGRDPNRIIGQGGFTNFIQTDAAVNPGNSGGPLVNVEGKVVGMNVAIATAPQTNAREGQNSGISFAIPLSTIERVADQLINQGVVARGFLGINYPGTDDQNFAILNQRGYRGRGVFVSATQQGGPAQKAGLKLGDIITRLNGQTITGVTVLRSAITNNGPGDKMKVEVVRDGATQEIEVTLGRLITDEERKETMQIVGNFGVADIAETAGEELFITEVRVPSAAFRAGVRPNQRVVAVGETQVGSTEQFFVALAEQGLHQGREVKLTLEQPQGGGRVEVKLGAR